MKRKITAPRVTVARRTASLRVPRKRIEALAAFVLRAEKANVGEVDVAIVDDVEMSALNRAYHHVRGTTDVLSFDLAGPGESTCAQIIVCAEEAIRQSKRRRQPTQRELLLYVTHGLLHLLGYDDTTPAKSQNMAKRQEEILAAFRQKRG